MKVLLIKDVIKLGRAGDIKKVADGYGRNFLIPQGLAIIATPGALNQVDRIKKLATTKRAQLNKEMGSVAEVLEGVILRFPVKAGETGKLYGSITTQDIADAINSEKGLQIDRRQVDSEPIRSLGEHKATIRLTMDLAPEITIIVHREGEAILLAEAKEAEVVAEEEVVDSKESE